MLAKVFSTAYLGIDAYAIGIEVDVSHGLPTVTIVGLPDQVVKESKERVRTAIRNSGFELPSQRVTINLAPANTKKEGPSFDLPIAIGWLAASGHVKIENLERFVLLGELALDGSLKATKGVLASALSLEGQSKILIVPKANAGEAALASGVAIESAETLRDVVRRLNGETVPATIPHRRPERSAIDHYDDDWRDVRGQGSARRAFEVAASGGHNLLLIGSPGSGKTLMARCLPGILPPLTLNEMLTVTRIYSVSHIGFKDGLLAGRRPFRSPHHSISTAGLVGGGPFPKPGEISLAHAGVLFLDEFMEFRRDTLEALRGPLEEGCVHISRARAGLSIPARFMLVAAMNPCPCGYLFDERKKCRCTMNQIHRYHAKVSGPILDRIDIHLEVPAVPYRELKNEKAGEPSEVIRKRVEAVRNIQEKRYKRESFLTNAELPARLIKSYCPILPPAEALLDQAMHTLHLSARAYHRILKLARTVADLAGEEKIDDVHIAEAIQYRSLDRRWSI